ncbi:unnamed protein product [Schistosoma mattheei]|uniref:Uncharacterized protein n=1 Tax=Schistosoma mattheei TaxID=31246 RepID=A0A183NZ53_9TREM|nr:unnamed protein product [Schistosoma mattheei]
MELPIDVGPPTIEETSMAIRHIKSDKAAGPDKIPAEALKADVAATARILHILFNKIWDEEQVPTNWKEGLLIKIPKKCDLSNCDNYQKTGKKDFWSKYRRKAISATVITTGGITPLLIPGKVFNRVLLNRMKDSVDAQLRDQ